VSDADVRGLVMAGWWLAHGLATLALTADSAEQFDADVASLAAQLSSGIVTSGDLVRDFQ